MKNIWKYILVGLGTFVTVLLLAIPFFMWGRMAGWRTFGMGSHMSRMPFMHGMGFMRFPLMGLRILIPLLLIGLVVLLVVVLVRRKAPVAVPVTPVPAAAMPTTPCPECGQFVQTEWVACPYCGKKLKE